MPAPRILFFSHTTAMDTSEHQRAPGGSKQFRDLEGFHSYSVLSILIGVKILPSSSSQVHTIPTCCRSKDVRL